MNEETKYSMPPVIDDSCKILILGSLPGEKSLQQQEYYAHSQNQFWKIICSVLNEEIPKNYELKKDMLLRNNISIWDVVKSANRCNSSLDSKIKNVIPNDLEKFLNENKNIQKILLNGGKANSLFKKHFKDINIDTVAVPSTSPAYAKMTIEEKTDLWRKGIFNSS